jgi:DNA-binding MarR family transcriptional regulator
MDINALDALAMRVGRFHRDLVRIFDRRLTEQGASFARTKLLMYLEKYGPKRAADIADDFSQAPRTVTEAIDGLERQGLVQRVADASDRRVKQVSLTEAGLRAVATTKPLRLQLVERVFGVLNEAEQAHFAALLDKMTAAIEAEERAGRRDD